MNWQIDDVPIFAAVIERNGVSAAARHLGLSKSTVSKALTRLESGLNVRLVERNARHIRITAEGEAFYHRAQRILDEVAEANAMMSGLAAQPAGRVAVAVPMAFCREILSPNLPGFHQRYPNVKLEIAISGWPLDMIRDGIDIAVLVGAPKVSDLTCRRLHTGRLVWVSSPSYAEELRPDLTANQLVEHVRVCERGYARRLSVQVGTHHQHIDLSRAPVQINDPLSVREILLNNGGVSFLPDQYCHEAIRDGRLVEICPHIVFDKSESILSAVYPRRRLLPARARVVLDFLTEICSHL